VQPVQPVQPLPGQPQQPPQPLQPQQPLQPLPPVQPILPIPPVATIAPLPGLPVAGAPGTFCCYYSPDQNDYCGKCKSKDTSEWNAVPENCQKAKGRICGVTRLFEAGQGAAVAAATEGAQRELPNVAMVLAWSGSIIMLAMLGAMSFARYRRAGQSSAAAVDSIAGHLMQESQAEAEQSEGVAGVA